MRLRSMLSIIAASVLLVACSKPEPEPAAPASDAEATQQVAATPAVPTYSAETFLSPRPSLVRRLTTMARRCW